MGNYRRELINADLERMHVPSRHWMAKFDEISDDGGDMSPRKIADKYIKKLDKMISKGVGLLLWGPNGTGKTAMSVVIGKEVRRNGYSVFFQESAALKRAVMEKTKFDGLVSIWDRAQSVEFLIIDDLGKGVQDRTGFGARLIDELIRHRNANKRPTIITTNMNVKTQLKEELKVSTMHALKECVIPVFVDGEDRRNKNIAEITDLLFS